MFHTIHFPGLVQQAACRPANRHQATENRQENTAARVETPAANIKETPDAWHVQIATPGLSKSDIQITVEQNILKISSTAPAQSNDENTRILRQQFGKYAIERSFRLPKTVLIENIEAKSENGILTLFLPKSPEATPRQIEIL